MTNEISTQRKIGPEVKPLGIGVDTAHGGRRQNETPAQGRGLVNECRRAKLVRSANAHYAGWTEGVLGAVYTDSALPCLRYG